MSKATISRSIATAHDVAAYILDKQDNGLPAMKLQKLVYYAQAWSLVWDDRPLFDDRIEAWANGSAVPSLYESLHGKFMVLSVEGNPDRLTGSQRETIDQVLGFYGNRSAQWLSDLTRMEEPWVKARHGLATGERGNHEISLAAMAEYYGSL